MTAKGPPVNDSGGPFAVPRLSSAAGCLMKFYSPLKAALVRYFETEFSEKTPRTTWKDENTNDKPKHRIEGSQKQQKIKFFHE
jgi:hypothetical protein